MMRRWRSVRAGCEIELRAAAPDRIDNGSGSGQDTCRGIHVAFTAPLRFCFTKRMQRQRETMDENPMNSGPQTQDANEGANRGGLSRRGILNIMKGIGAGLWRRRHPGQRNDRRLRPADHRRTGFAQRHDHDRRQPTPAAAAGIRRRDQGNRQGFEALVAAARRAAQGRAQRSAHHDRRPGLWRQRHLRRRHPDAGAGPDRESRAALHRVPLHRALLADAGGADHRPQPPRGRASA